MVSPTERLARFETQLTCLFNVDFDIVDSNNALHEVLVVLAYLARKDVTDAAFEPFETRPCSLYISFRQLLRQTPEYMVHSIPSIQKQAVIETQMADNRHRFVAQSREEPTPQVRRACCQTPAPRHSHITLTVALRLTRRLCRHAARHSRH